MKKHNLIYFALIVLTLAGFFGYRAWDAVRVDSEAPEIYIPETVPEVSVHDDDSVILGGISAKDNRDGDVSDSLVVESITLMDPDGTATVKCAAFDRAGNVAKGTLTIRFTDYESPRFSLSKPLLFTANSSFDVLSVIGCEDMLDGDISHRIRATSLDETSIATVGVHEVQFRATNSMGETAELILPVEVTASGTFQGSLALTDYLIYIPVGGDFDPEDYLSSYTQGSLTVSLRSGVPEGYELDVEENVNTQVPGVYCVKYELHYTRAGGIATGYTNLIVVVEG